MIYRFVVAFLLCNIVVLSKADSVSADELIYRLPPVNAETPGSFQERPNQQFWPNHNVSLNPAVVGQDNITGKSLSSKKHAPDDDTFPWSVLYDKGFLIKPKDKEKNPFQLEVNGRIQFRHTGFVRQREEFIDRATGNLVPIEPRNDFEIERGRLQFGGYVHDPKLQYYMNIDFDTDDNHRAVAQDFWFNYEFSDALNVYAGKAFIPGSRDWLNGALSMRFGDRSMPTTFFRPDRTVGIWAIGEPIENFHYRVMIGNGFSTADLRPISIDDNFMYSGSTWWDPWGDYGTGASDLLWHCTPVVRIGHSFTYAKQSPEIDGTPQAEQNFVRLSDGVRLVDTGALAPGVTVSGFDIYLYSIDLAGKWRGFSFNGEYFMRWLTDLRADGPTGFNKLYDHGFYFDSGYMLIREHLELNGRIGLVSGLFGDHWEYAGGINWFFNGHNNKLTIDVTSLDGSPADNTGANYRRGDDGVMIRSAWQVAF